MAMAIKAVIVCFLSVVVSCQLTPDFSRQEDGTIRVTAPRFPGVTEVKLTVKTQGKHLSSTMTQSPADGHWRTKLPGVTIKDDDTPYYVTEYHFQYGVHKTTGHIHIDKTEDAEDTAAPVSPRYLQRRSTRVFFDDFSSNTIDHTKWKLAVTGHGGGNEEFNMYTPEAENAFVRNHVLYIKPTLTEDHFGDDFLAKGDLDVNAIWGQCTFNKQNGCHLTGVGNIPPVMSAKLMSIGTGHIRYGKITVRAKMPKGDWLWPAIWMMPTENHYGYWPRSGEIDIIETRGNQHYHAHNGLSLGRDFDHVNIHYGPQWNHKKSPGTGYRIHGTTFADGFHSYWIDWTENHIRLGVDGHTIMARDTPPEGFWQEGHFTGTNIWANGGKDAPFDRPFHLILNVAIGGRWFSHNYGENQPYAQPWGDHSDNKMTEFWNARHLWLPTWHGDDVALQISSVTMEQY